MHIKDIARKRSLKSRLRRVAGQLEGIAEMIEHDKECADIAVQLAACKGALQHTLGAFTTCAIEETRTKKDTQNDKDITRLLKLLM